MLTQSIFGSLFLTLAVAVAGQAEDRVAAFAITIDAFQRTSVDKQKEIVKAAFQHRLELAANVSLKAYETGSVHEYSNGVIGLPLRASNGRRYEYWRAGGSYRAKWELGGVDVVKPREWGESGYDSAKGVVTSTYRSDLFPGQVHARIDSVHNSYTTTLRYLYWLDGRASPRDPANFVLSDIVRQMESSVIECDVASGMVKLTIPWTPPWEQVPGGTREYTLDPVKGFLPLKGKGVLKYEQPGGRTIWRTEDFSVEASQLISDVWVPTKLKETIRSSAGGESMTQGEAAVLTAEILSFSFNSVKPEDLSVVVPEGAFLNNAIERTSYYVGRDGTRAK